MCSFLRLFATILVTIYVGLMYENSAIMLLVYLEAAFVFVSLIYLLYRRHNLKGAIEVPIGISEVGKENMVKIRVNNNSHLPMMRLKARVVVEDTLSGLKRKFWMKIDKLYAGENEYIRNVILPSAGNYEISIKKLRIYDFSGFLYMNMNIKSVDRVQVMPQLYDVPVRLTMSVKGFYGDADVYDENIPGNDKSELFQIREYQKGDRLQSVHWKMTAKQDEIMVKEHSFPKSCPVVLFLDFAPNAKMRNKVMRYYEIAISMSYSIMAAGCPHYIVWFDESERDVKRLRVDDEESLYYAIISLMKIKWEKGNEDIVARYNSKFLHEPYIHALSLNERLELKKNEELYVTFNEKDVEKSLSDIEILL